MNEDVVVVSGLSKKYGKKCAVKNLSFNVRRNTVFGLLGSNGAGKSTTLHMLTGLLPKNEGGLYIFGETVKDKYSINLKRRVAIVPQKISLYQDLTIYDNLYFFAKTYGFSRNVVLKKIAEFQEIFKLGNLNRVIKYLSGGYQRRVSFAVALIGNPDLVILDEALVGIDIETKKIIVDLLLKLKETKTIIITTHSIDDAEKLCDDVLLLHQGERKVYGNTKSLIEEYNKNHGRSLRIVFRDESRIKSFVKELISSIPNEVLVKDLVVSVKFNKKILLNSKSNDVSSILILADSYREDIADIEIEKAGLYELMMDAIKI